MDSNQEKCEKMDTDHSQDEAGPSTSSASCERRVSLLDLSDDVLLLILQHCAAHDLKALGFSCARLGTLIVDRTLWGKVDARGKPSCRQRVAWLMKHGLHEHTTEIHVEGYAREARGCLGHINRTKEEADAEADAEAEAVVAAATENGDDPNDCKEKSNDNDKKQETEKEKTKEQNESQPTLSRQHSRWHINIQQLPRYTQYPSWPVVQASVDNREACVMTTGECSGPQFTMPGEYLNKLQIKCPKLTTLSLEYCNINYSNTKLSNFPRTIKKLSLRGSKCYNLALDRSLLFRIQEYLPDLELLDVSECEWVEPATLLPISKLPNLKHLLMMDCLKLSEFVAYASLAARYGFKMLETLDLRGSPVGDSEVSALGWLPELRDLRLRPPARERDPPTAHSHYREPPAVNPTLLEPWELQEPEYFRIKPEIDDLEPTEDPLSRNGENTDHKMYPLLGITEGCILYPGDGPSTSGFYCNSDSNKRASTSNTEDESAQPKKRPDETLARRPVVVKVNTELFKASSSGITLDRRNPRKRKASVEEITLNKMEQNNSSLLHLLRRGIGNPNLRHGNAWYGEDKDFGNNAGARNAQTLEETTQNVEAQSSSNGDTKNCENGEQNNDGHSPLIAEENDANTDECKSSQSGSQTPNINGEIGEGKCESQENEGPSEQCTDNLQNKSDHNGESSKRRKTDYVTLASEPSPEESQSDDEEDDNDITVDSRRVLYVNVGSRRPLVYSIENDRVYRQVPSARSLSSLFFPPQPHLDPTSLVTDSAIRRFGRADNDVVGYVYIGTNGLRENDGRPDRSNLRSLNITGFRHITDHTLMHLATAAPLLETLDLSETNVTEHGVENFRSLRPDCVVTYSKFQEPSKEGCKET